MSNASRGFKISAKCPKCGTSVDLTMIPDGTDLRRVSCPVCGRRRGSNNLTDDMNDSIGDKNFRLNAAKFAIRRSVAEAITLSSAAAMGIEEELRTVHGLAAQAIEIVAKERIETALGELLAAG